MKKIVRIFLALLLGAFTAFSILMWQSVAFLEYTSEGKAIDPRSEFVIHTDSEPLFWGLLSIIGIVLLTTFCYLLFKKYRHVS